jgi:hypothetical protein
VHTWPLRCEGTPARGHPRPHTGHNNTVRKELAVENVRDTMWSVFKASVGIRKMWSAASRNPLLVLAHGRGPFPIFPSRQRTVPDTTAPNNIIGNPNSCYTRGWPLVRLEYGRSSEVYYFHPAYCIVHPCRLQHGLSMLTLLPPDSVNWGQHVVHTRVAPERK